MQLGTQGKEHTMTSMTPYAAAKVVNAALTEAGVDKQIPAQMMYNYTSARVRKGKAPLITTDAEGKITEAGLTEWLAKYLVKQGVAVQEKVSLVHPDRELVTV